ncbi:MAG: zinc ribbon domain-containing protein [Paenibacillus macerans]|uniref:Double zinc ribbon family protein n=1 Tax=Paenibacillus macerans TaxID=44252 RepID=A0A090Z5Q0_PAEMA|nr:zinc ribbon domain-containing protein [Paenibacillus macerans]KFN06569.1 double zinc ribbon family protein [Paenibacillus macerans]MBS5909030.1 zinc ribbon domain-containing protein [Paenibacillus macerans]MCY7559487.1 zinc-ribbon domain-containing protein [Paenibacillus macerans]MDU7473880.1 zinc ribbon domain-containing protein [Paenibacillus macerans]MEC0150616.1 zinc ribbon domain-containing protein [Paenibacillus macerans]
MNFLQRLKDGAGKVTDRAQNVVEIGKLNTQISNIERELGLYYQKMGEIFYEGYRKKDMSYAEKEMLDLAKTCDLLAEERDEIRAKVAELKNERLCGACGRTVSEDAVFCQYCGHKLVKRKKAVIPEDLIEPVRAAAPTAEDTRIAASPEPPGKETKRTIDLEQLLFSANLIESAEKRDSEAVREPADPEEEERLLRNLERERKRQEELDRRIRSWTQKAEQPDEEKPSQEKPSPGITIATVKCQICGSMLVKGTKWCPHCGSEQV